MDKDLYKEKTIEEPIWLHFSDDDSLVTLSQFFKYSPMAKGILVCGVDTWKKSWINEPILIEIEQEDYEISLLTEICGRLNMVSDFEYLLKVMKMNSLEVISLGLLEDSYELTKDGGELKKTIKHDLVGGFGKPQSLFGCLTTLLYMRYLIDLPLTIYSLNALEDIVEENILFFATRWKDEFGLESEFLDFIATKIDYKCGYIDRIVQVLPKESFTVFPKLRKHLKVERDIYIAEKNHRIWLESPERGNSLSGINFISRKGIEGIVDSFATVLYYPVLSIVFMLGLLFEYENYQDALEDDIILWMAYGIGFEQLAHHDSNGKGYIVTLLKERLFSKRLTFRFLEVDRHRLKDIETLFLSHVWRITYLEKENDILFIPLCAALWFRFFIGSTDKEEELQYEFDKKQSSLCETLKTKPFSEILQAKKIISFTLPEWLAVKIENLFLQFLDGKNAILRTLSEIKEEYDKSISFNAELYRK